MVPAVAKAAGIVTIAQIASRTIGQLRRRAMSDTINQDRRRFLDAAAATRRAAVQPLMSGARDVDSRSDRFPHRGGQGWAVSLEWPSCCEHVNWYLG
jgi:hypothetical protein